MVALVGGAGALTNTGGSIQLPGTVYAGVEGADAPNAAAAAAGAAAATSALEIADGGNGGKDDCGEDAIEELAEWVDPDLINFSQRTVSPNDYVKSMKDGTWDDPCGSRQEMSRIVVLWRQGLVPDFSGLYRADGAAWSIEVDGAALTYFRVREPFDLNGRLADNPDEVAEIDESARTALPDGRGHVCCGEGAHGSEGFFARLDAEGGLVWVVFLRDGNPFHEIAVHGVRVTFTNNLGRSVTVDLTDELYA